MTIIRGSSVACTFYYTASVQCQYFVDNTIKIFWYFYSIHYYSILCNTSQEEIEWSLSARQLKWCKLPSKVKLVRFIFSFRICFSALDTSIFILISSNFSETMYFFCDSPSGDRFIKWQLLKISDLVHYLLYVNHL